MSNQDWVNELAAEVDGLVQQPEAMLCFREMVECWELAQLAACQNLAKWKEKRQWFVDNEFVGPPNRDWIWETEGWVPPDLALDSKPPGITNLFRPSHYKNFNLEEKYTALAVVHDHEKGPADRIHTCGGQADTLWKSVLYDHELKTVAELQTTDKKCLYGVFDDVTANIIKRQPLPPEEPVERDLDLHHTSTDETLPDTPVTLAEFMKEYCNPLDSEQLFESRLRSLQKAASRKSNKVKLPKHEGQWKRGQSKKYRPSVLKKNWPTYRQSLPHLPELK